MLLCKLLLELLLYQLHVCQQVIVGLGAKANFVRPVCKQAVKAAVTATCLSHTLHGLS
jgi:hypothetical protein